MPAASTSASRRSISASGWGHGEKKFRGQHPGAEAWAKFTAMLEEGKRHRERTGKPLMVPRYDIVPIPEHLRTHVVPGSIQMFPAETAQSMFDFRANDVVGKIAPRPLLLLHSSDDHVTPVEQSVGLFSTPASRPSCTCSPTPTISCSPKATPACSVWCRTGSRIISRSRRR